MTNINCTADCVYQSYGKCMLSYVSDSINLEINKIKKAPENSKLSIVDCAYYRKK